MCRRNNAHRFQGVGPHDDARNPHSRHCHTRSTHTQLLTLTVTHTQMSCPPRILTISLSHSQSAYHTHSVTHTHRTRHVLDLV